MRRELFACVISMLSGVILSHVVRLLAPAVGLTALLGLRLGWKVQPHRKLAMLIVVSFLCGTFLFYGESLYFSIGERIDSQRSHTLQLKIEQVERVEKEQYRLTCRIESIDGRQLARLLPQRVLVSCFRYIQDPWGLCGRRILTSGALAPPESSGNPRTFDYSLYLKSKGISHVTTMQEYTLCDGAQNPLALLKTNILRGRDRFLLSLPCKEAERALLSGILFGDTQSLEEETYEQFRSNGTAHVLAVSGLHIGILYAAWRRLFGKKQSKGALFLLLVFLCFYGTITLWSVSVTRAILLILLVVYAERTDRRYDLLTSLSAVALLVVLRNPFAVFGASFQMSFLAVCAMAFFGPFLLRKMPLWVPDSVAGILAIQMGMIPYTAYVFNYVPLLAILCNLPVVYLLSLIVPMGLAAMVLCLITGTSGVPGMVLVSLATMLRDVNGWFSMLGRFAADVQSPPFWFLLGIYCIMFFVTSEEFVILKGRGQKEALRRWGSLLLAGCALLFACGGTPMDKASLIFVDVGQGDCLHIRAGHSVDLLIDGGGKEDYNVGKKILKPYLLKNGAGDVDLAMATHLHTDHYKGLQELCACYRVKRLLISGKAGDVIRVSDRCRIELLWPEERNPDTEDENVNSLIFRVEIDGVSVLVTGDLTEEGEQAMLDRYRGTDKLDCDILKVAHHGSKYSSTSAFLEAVSPRIAVISVGRNTYGHPTPEALARLRECGAAVYRTDTMGAVGIITRGGMLKVCKTKDTRKIRNGSAWKEVHGESGIE